MKRLIVLFALIGTLCSCGSGQKSQPANMINGHEYVDLGLPSGLKWATCNIGASSPEEYGDIYSYGNIKPIKDGDQTKIDLPDGLDISGDPDHDAATADWGNGWRMPTYEEMLELEIYCTQEFIVGNGIPGLKITGPNGNHIILPDNATNHAYSGLTNILEYKKNGGACIRPVFGKKTISPMVQRYLNYEKVAQSSYLVCNIQDVSEGEGLDFKCHDSVTLKHMYIHTGYPKENYRSTLGSSFRIEIDDEIVTVDEIKDHYNYHRERYLDSEWADIYAIICADKDTRMGLIEDIIYQLRNSGCPAHKIVFKTHGDYNGFNGLPYDFSSQSSGESARDNLINRRNILTVKINSQDRILAGSKPCIATEVREEVQRLITNPYDDPNLPEKVTVAKTYNGKDYVFLVSKGMVSLQNDARTSYGTYLIVYNEIIGAFNELRDAESLRAFGKRFFELDKELQEIIKSVVPVNIALGTNPGSETVDIDEVDGTLEIIEIVDEEDISEAVPMEFVNQNPSFQGEDMTNFSKWVNERLEYPEIAKENGVQGRVTLQFTVEKDGSITNVKVLRGVDPSLDKEAVRVVSMSPKWTPGKVDGRTVPIQITFPVIFQLR